ncbi:ABC transporter ATP-binding protein [Solibacillus daqui]|uniref:ABC transporter ATP-binding protein n=1 Tax=Solibacillus daqui TaxID=2912187 RepID=UPI002365BB25|nr:ABC transporter ATP-binding protein [Solibacillus daqui]
MANKHGGGHPGAPGMKGEKPNHFKATIKKLIRYCKSYMPFITFSLVLAFISTAFTVYSPDLLSDMTDEIQQGLMGSMDLDVIQKIGYILAVLYGLSFIFSYVQGFMMATITQRITKKMRGDLSTKINRLPLNYFDKTTVGNTLSRITNDVDTIGQTLNNSLGQLVSAVATFIGVLIMMFYTNWIMAITAILSTLLGFGLMSVIMAKSQKYFDNQQAQLAEINGHIEEIYTGHQIVKVYNGEAEAISTFHATNDKLYDNAWRAQFMSGVMMPLMQFIGNFGYVAVCIVGALLVINDVITIGVIVAFMVYIRLFTQPLAQIAQAATNLQSTAAAAERVFAFLEEPELEREDAKQIVLGEVKGAVSFQHVSFGYTENQQVINDFTLDVQAGQKVAIVGPTGAGKTTIVNLLMRFYEMNSGDIKIDGISIKDLTREQVHEQFCMVLQDTWLFEGSIRDNIVYSTQNVSDEQVIAAAKAVGMHQTISALPDGYNTLLNDKVSLSIGQKQLLTIARAMIENAPLLILDEATSSVDTRTEVQIQAAMDQLSVGKTSFVIAHRLSTIRNADVIIVMKDGSILETGNHEELLSRGGFYADLYNSQFESAS